MTRETTYYSPRYDKFWLFEIFHRVQRITRVNDLRITRNLSVQHILHFVAFEDVAEKNDKYFVNNRISVLCNIIRAASQESWIYEYANTKKHTHI